jgi:CRISPR-associated protein Csb2
MTLVLEIEHLLGVSFAAQTQASSVPDWPPQPDRVFSALVAAWGARGERPDERRALEWLETQPSPELAVSGGFARTTVTVFVPPNDPQTGRVGNRSVMPELRRRQPRRFPAFRPYDPVVRLVWRDADADREIVAALNALAADTPYVGHSSSLTRCRFRNDAVPAQTALPRRWVYKGRLAELERAYHAGHRPSPGADVRDVTPTEAGPPQSIFDDRWLILEHVGGDMPDLRAAALVSKALRYALMSGYKRIGQEAAIPAAVSGHSTDGSPTSLSHLAIVPLAFLGSQFADGRVLGLALIPPREEKLLDGEDFRNAVRAVAAYKEDKGRRELKLSFGSGDLLLTPSGEGTRRSLDPMPYVALAKTWGTCTPIVLDRHLKAKGSDEREAEISGLIRDACANIGLPEPTRISTGKHSAVQAAPSAYRSGRAPRWTGWRLPESLASRQLAHAMIQFNEPVRGPVILGAGRFVGLGLCRALDPEKR